MSSLTHAILDMFHNQNFVRLNVVMIILHVATITARVKESEAS